MLYYWKELERIGLNELWFQVVGRYIPIYKWMASCTSGLTHIKKTMKIYVIVSNNFINIRVSHLGLDHLVTDFVSILCYFVFIRFILYFMLQRAFFSKSSKCGLAHLCMMPSKLALIWVLISEK